MHLQCTLLVGPSWNLMCDSGNRYELAAAEKRYRRGKMDGKIGTQPKTQTVWSGFVKNCENVMTINETLRFRQ
jgi:hypothetical protein